MLLVPAFRPFAAVLLTLMLPGWGWSLLVARKSGWLVLTTLSLGFSFSITILLTLGLHYLPGPVHLWPLLITLNLITLFPLVLLPKPLPSSPAPPLARLIRHPLTYLFLLALLLRVANLSYSEFQGDEALALIFAAEAIEGHEDALFLRGKGPGEILLPLPLWRLTGPINEGLARIPFVMAGMAGIITIYLLGKDLFSDRVGLFSAGLFAASGFMVGFSRIVQYQTLVVWMSALALWTLWHWRKSGRLHWAFVSGLFLGLGLLAHYDAVLVVPALAWLVVRTWRRDQSGFYLKSAGLWLIGCLGAALPFYVPYYLDPQFSRTQRYVEDRIGVGLKNHLDAFFHFNSFYSSFYFTLAMWLLLIGFIVWALHNSSWGRGWGPFVAAMSLLGLAIWTDALGVWIAVPIGLILLAAFLSDGLTLPHRLALLWFIVPFLGYNFAVARPLTHIYTVIPGWALLAGITLSQLRLKPSLVLAGGSALFLIFSGYLWTAFVRTNPTFLYDYPASRPAFYWSPYPDRPETGFFGFPHRTGWKTVGALLVDGVLIGDYDSNEEEDITSWYTRHTPRACDPGAEFYFIASDLLDERPLPEALLAEAYQAVGQAQLANGKTLAIEQQLPTTLNLGLLDDGRYAPRFDQSAYPAAFTRTPHWDMDDGTNFGGIIQLAGYSLDARRAYPGGRIVLTLFWQLLEPAEESYKAFVQLDPERKFAQADSFPVCSRFPTDRWRPGQIIADQHALHLSPDTPPGSHPLAVGLYLPDDGRRLDILDVAGNPAGVSLTLAEVEVRSKD